MFYRLAPEENKKTPSPVKGFADIKFMVTDDSPFIRNMVQSMLLQMGARHIAYASDGEAALTALAKTEGRCDCIISDWNMEPMGGLKFLQKIRCGQSERTPADTCFILLTGHADSSVVNLAIALDVNAYLVKPVSFEKLAQSVTTAMQRVWKLKGPSYYGAVSGIEIDTSANRPANRVASQ